MSQGATSLGDEEHGAAIAPRAADLQVEVLSTFAFSSVRKLLTIAQWLSWLFCGLVLLYCFSVFAWYLKKPESYVVTTGGIVVGINALDSDLSKSLSKFFRSGSTGGGK